MQGVFRVTHPGTALPPFQGVYPPSGGAPIRGVVQNAAAILTGHFGRTICHPRQGGVNVSPV